MAGVLTSSAIVKQKMASQGIILGVSSAGNSSTAAAAGSGYMSATIGWNTVGTTLGTSYYGIDVPTGLSGQLRMILTSIAQGNNQLTGAIGMIYKIGTLNLAATGAQFTHNANWSGSIKRTNGAMGTATAINMTPIVHITTATTTTAPVFNINSYVNQAGATITGAKTMTMPSATTAIGSGYICRLEDGDSGVQDITAINVSVAGATGAATIYGLEWFSPLGSDASSMPSMDDMLFSPPHMPDINPASPTPNSGTLTYNTDHFLVPLYFGSTGANSTIGLIYCVQDN